MANSEWKFPGSLLAIRRDQPGQLPHVVERNAGAGRAQLVGMTGEAMAAAMKTQHGHSGVKCADNAGDAVLDGHATSWRCMHLRGGEQKQVRRRFAALDLGGRENVRRKRIIETRASEPMPD